MNVEPNLLHLNAIRSAVNKFKVDNSEFSTKIAVDHKAFLGLVMQYYLPDITIYDIDESIVDGSNDCGIDAIYIDEIEGQRPEVYIFQSKYHTKNNAFEVNFEGSALEKMQNAINNFILRETFDKSYQNNELNDRLNNVRTLDMPIYHIIFCSNTLPPNKEAREKYNDFIMGHDLMKSLETHYVHISEISQFIIPKQTRNITEKLQFTGEKITTEIGSVRMVLGSISVKDLAKLREVHGEALFDKNVRGFLTRRNIINRKIEETASSEEDSPYFLFLNNGITIVCDDFTADTRLKAASIKIENMQIVNGGQTTNSIFEAYKKNILRDDAEVLVKVLRISDNKLLEKIILSTNSQTRVTDRDLRSNDDVQKLIEKVLLDYGYYYEARKDKYKGDKKAYGKRVDAEVAAQSYYAAIKQAPAIAKNQKRKLFGDYYDSIFYSKMNALDLLNSFILFTKVRNLNTQYKNTYSFANDATLHLVALLYKEIKYENKIIMDFVNKDKFIVMYNDILDATQEVVKEIINEEGDTYSHRKTFIDNDTIGRIEEAYRDRKLKR